MACDAPATPTGPPRCEPAEELNVERRLKEGFRALVEADPEAAVRVFEHLLSDEPGHPEAALGLRLARRGDAVVRPQPRPTQEPRGHVVVGGQPVAIDLPVNTERHRFEEVARLRAAWVGSKDAATAWAPELPRHEGDPGEPAALEVVDPLEAVDLVVLGDTESVTAAEAVARYGALGRTAHFVIDWDGAIYQTLDLAWRAEPSGRLAIDRRSLAVDLVNPVSAERPPLPPEASAAGVRRTLSEPASAEDRVSSPAWGYTEAQLDSLIRLTRALMKVSRRLEARLPAGVDGRVPRSVLPSEPPPAGVVGRLHLDPSANAPGPGFDWERFGEALRY